MAVSVEIAEVVVEAVEASVEIAVVSVDEAVALVVVEDQEAVVHPEVVEHQEVVVVVVVPVAPRKLPSSHTDTLVSSLPEVPRTICS